MSDNIQYIDVDDDDFIDAPKALRDHVRKLQSRLTERDQEVTSLRGQVTSTALGDVLREFKNPERVKRDLLSDKVDPLDTEAVQAWLGKNADDYARGSATPATPDPDEAEAAAHRQLNAGTEFRQPADMTKVEAAIAEITPDMSGAEVVAIYAKHGL